MNDEVFPRIVDADSIQVVGTRDYLSIIWGEEVREYSDSGFSELMIGYQVDILHGVVSVEDAVLLIRDEEDPIVLDVSPMSVADMVRFTSRLETEWIVLGSEADVPEEVDTPEDVVGLDHKRDDYDTELVLFAHNVLANWLTGDI